LALRLREGMQIFVKTLHRQGTQIFTQVAASPTSFGLSNKSPPRTTCLHLARQVSASHDKSPSRTASLAPTSAWAQTHGSGEATNACEEADLHVTRERELAAMQATCPSRSLNAILTSRATITSPSTSTLPTRKAQPEALEHPLRRARA
jgi:hypothetical protein